MKRQNMDDQSLIEEQCLIISGGDYEDIPPYMHKIKMVIACDRGWEYAKKLGYKPNVVIGDFDSSEAPEDGAEIIRLPERKDDTDTMYAARYALKLGYKKINICCAFGGRLDHTVANIQTAAFLARNGAFVRMMGKDTEAFVFTAADKVIDGRDGYSLSVFALSDSCEGVTICGTKYEVENIGLCDSFPVGVSNLWKDDRAEITVKSGVLMVLMSRLNNGEHI